jgi:hypothetical protein
MWDFMKKGIEKGDILDIPYHNSGGFSSYPKFKTQSLTKMLY